MNQLLVEMLMHLDILRKQYIRNSYIQLFYLIFQELKTNTFHWNMAIFTD